MIAAAMTAKYATYLFTPADVQWLTGVTEGQYRYWISEGVVSASVLNEPDRPFGRVFSFVDLVAFRAVKLLRDLNLPLDELRKIQPWIKHHFDEEDLQVQGHLYVVDDKRLDEAESTNSALRVDFDAILRELIERIEHSREMKGQIGKIECSLRVQGGEPVIAGTRVTVETIKAFHRAGVSVEVINEQYPHVTIEDIKAAIAYTPESSDVEAAD
jgi:uncharacterized protein (DUF433 family)